MGKYVCALCGSLKRISSGLPMSRAPIVCATCTRQVRETRALRGGI